MWREVQALSQSGLAISKEDRSDCTGQTKVCTLYGECGDGQRMLVQGPGCTTNDDKRDLCRMLRDTLGKSADSGGEAHEHGSGGYVARLTGNH